MANLTHNFEKIEITVNECGNVIGCQIDGIEGELVTAHNRIVFRFGNKFVIKFDGVPRGVNRKRDVKIQNLREVKNYKLIAKEDEKYFAKILRTGTVSGKYYVVQEYVRTTRRMFKKEYAQFQSLRSKYGIVDAAPSTVGKEHHNVAVSKDGFKLFDLGYENSMRPTQQNPLL